MAPSQSSPWLTASELARFLSVPESWVYARTYRGARDPLPYKRVGRWLRFDKEEVQAWVDERTRREKEEKAAAVAEWVRLDPPPAKAVSGCSAPLPFRVPAKARRRKK